MKNRQALRAYLLGTLSESDQNEVERSLLADDATYELLLAIEEELIDESLQGKLTAGESVSLNRYLGNLPDGRANVEFARGLGRALDAMVRPNPVEAPQRPLLSSPSPWWWRQWASAAAAALFLLAGLMSAVIWTQSARIEGLEAALGTPGSETNRSAPRVSVLTAGTLRSARAMQTVRIPAGQVVVSLVLDLGEDPCETYRAMLYDADGRERISISKLVPGSDTDQIRIPLTLPTQGLASGDYFVTLAGEVEPDEYELLARYDFRLLFE